MSAAGQVFSKRIRQHFEIDLGRCDIGASVTFEIATDDESFVSVRVDFLEEDAPTKIEEQTAVTLAEALLQALQPLLAKGGA